MTTDIVTKKCPKCGDTKPVEAFYNSKSSKDGLQPRCKSCCAEYSAVWVVANSERVATSSSAYYQANKERVAERHAAYRSENKAKISASIAAWRTANKEIIDIKSRAWLDANRDKYDKYQTLYRAENREKEAARSAAWYAANKERRNQLTAAWAAANPDARRIHKHNRRARESQNGGALSKGITEKLFKLQQGKCACCGESLFTLPSGKVDGKKVHLDHIMPLSKGGTNTDQNMQLLTSTCNLEKHKKDPIDFMQSRGFLL
jgi:5-methylcytosine-specific restriction endonuclease McrA/uncharacterized protein (UPF0212 family)